MAMAMSATLTCSPVDRSMSISRAGGRSVISLASAISSSVVLPRAETTTRTCSPRLCAWIARRAAARILFESATLVPPNFCTSNDNLGNSRSTRIDDRPWRRDRRSGLARRPDSATHSNHTTALLRRGGASARSPAWQSRVGVVGFQSIPSSPRRAWGRGSHFSCKHCVELVAFGEKSRFHLCCDVDSGSVACRGEARGAIIGKFSGPRRPAGAQGERGPNAQWPRGRGQGRRPLRQPAHARPESITCRAQAYRHPEDPDHRRRADRHRPGLRVRLLGHPGVQGAARGGLRGRAGQLEPGHDHDRPRDGRPDLHRADHARGRRADHRRREARRRAADARRADRPERRPGAGTRAGRWSGTAAS